MGGKGSGRYKAGSGKQPRKPPEPEPQVDARGLLGLRFYTVAPSEITETDCKEASREVLRLLALGQIDHRVAETFDKGIRTTLQGIRQEASAGEMEKLKELVRRREEAVRKAQQLAEEERRRGR